MCANQHPADCHPVLKSANLRITEEFHVDDKPVRRDQSLPCPAPLPSLTMSEKQYFIITRTSRYSGPLKAGSLCYTCEPGASKSLRAVIPLGQNLGSSYSVDPHTLSAITADEAGLLLPLDASERLQLRDGEALPAALKLHRGAEVTVDREGRRLNGVVRYIGSITPSVKDPISGVFFGIELQGEDRGKGNTDGSYQEVFYFRCERGCGVFVPFPMVRQRKRRHCSSSAAPESAVATAAEMDELAPGDRVTYLANSYCRHGMVVEVLERDGGHFVRISTDTDENGKRGGEVELPLHMVFKGEVPAGPGKMDARPPSAMDPHGDTLYLDLNSLVEVTLAAGNSYGIIRWIGKLPDRQELMAGLELEEERGVSDGTLKSERYFQCPPKKALFVRMSSCRPDSRFTPACESEATQAAGPVNLSRGVAPEEAGEFSSGRTDPTPPVGSEQVRQVLVGRMKGIQGHCNSCYMDAALFSLFSCSSVLDSMLFKSTEPQDAPIQRTLLHDIVNPLRSQGFVEGHHIMKLRQQLQNHGYSHSFTTDEKDPEEFLSIIMHHILALDPLLKLSAGGKVQESYCYQIFLDQNHSLVLPTVQQLLEHSFHSSGLKLAEVPSCLILQMPRFGKKFKMFDKIIPSLELDVTDLLCEGPQQCVLCGGLAQLECPDCFKDSVFSPTGFKVFCSTCSSQVHAHPQRRLHSPVALDIPEGFGQRQAGGGGGGLSLTRDKLELFAVLCIETSHYVSFIRHGPDASDWIFFDSMADREGESDGYNIPEVRECPEVDRYLAMPPAELANQAPRDMAGVSKRLFCDAYMYLYQNTSLSLYR